MKENLYDPTVMYNNINVYGLLGSYEYFYMFVYTLFIFYYHQLYYNQ